MGAPSDPKRTAPAPEHGLPVDERYWATEHFRERHRASLRDPAAFWAGVAR